MLCPQSRARYAGGPSERPTIESKIMVIILGFILLALAFGLTVGGLPHFPSWTLLAASVALTLLGALVFTWGRDRSIAKDGEQATEVAQVPRGRSFAGFLATLVIGWAMVYTLMGVGLALGFVTASSLASIVAECAAAVLLAVLLYSRKRSFLVVAAICVVPASFVNAQMGSHTLRLLWGKTSRLGEPQAAPTAAKADLYYFDAGHVRADLAGPMRTFDATGSSTTRWTYAVTAAPVVGAQWTPRRPVGVWAVCGELGDTHTMSIAAFAARVRRRCDAKWTAAATRSGAWFVPGGQHEHEEKTAIRAAMDADGLRSTARASMVTWVGDPIEAAWPHVMVLVAVILEYGLTWLVLLAWRWFRTPVA